jgi:hypothetical protein
MAASESKAAANGQEQQDITTITPSMRIRLGVGTRPLSRRNMKSRTAALPAPFSKPEKEAADWIFTSPA